MTQKIQLLIVDPQNDFCDRQRGALFVEGADADMERLAKFVRRIGSQIDRIHVTLDSHPEIHVAHPSYWKDRDGRHPAPYTVIRTDDVQTGVWTPTEPKWLRDSRTGFGAIDYVAALESSGKYPLCIWPPHCLLGSWGHHVVTPLQNALNQWEAAKSAQVNFVTKGSNSHTEHYSAICAEVPDPTDSMTSLNVDLLQILMTADEIVLAGEAASHCVASTALDADAFCSGTLFAEKLVLLSDATSPVKGFETQYRSFKEKLTAKGMRVMSTEEYCK